MLTTKRTSRTNCSFQISAAVITVTHSQASDVLVGTQKHENLWVWGWVTVVDTMPCFRDSKKKKVIDLSTLSRHSEPSGASWPSSDLQAAAVTQTRSPAAVGTPPLRSENTDASLCRQAEKEGERRLTRSSALLCLFACLHNWSNFCSLQTYKCVSIQGFATTNNLCGPALLLLLHKQMINPVLTNVRLAANQLSHCSTKDVSGCWRHWALQRNIHAPLIQSIFAGIITLWMWIMTAGVVTWQK